MGTLFLPVLVLAGQADTEDRQGLGTDILRQLEELKEPQAVRLIIVGEVAIVEGMLPAVLVQRAVLHGAYGVLPLVAGV